MSAYKNRLESAVPEWRQFAPTAFLVILGAVFSVALCWAAYSWEMRSIKRDFDALADARCKEVSNAFHETAKLLDFTDNVFMLAPRADSPAFAEYLRSLKRLVDDDLLRHPDIRSLIWIPRATGAERSAYEQAARTTPYSRFQVDKSGDSPKTVPAARSSEYFPIYLCASKDPDPNSLGEDLTRDSAAWKVMKRSQDTGNPLAIDPIKMSPDDGGGMGYRIFQPLSYSDALGKTRDQGQFNAGFICLDLDVGRLVDKTMENIKPGGVDFQVCDVSGGNSVPLCRHWSRLQPPLAAEDGTYNELQSSWASEFFGRKVLVHCSSSTAFWIGRTIWQPWVLLCGGLVLTLVAAGYQFNLVSRNSEVEQAVTKRIARFSEEMGRRQHADRLWDDPNPSNPDLTSGVLQETAVASDMGNDDSEQ